MELQTLKDLLLWCSLLNMAIFFAMFMVLAYFRDFVYKLHSRWFPMPQERFNMVIYALLGLYKIIIIVFNIVPWIALNFVD